MAKATIIGGTEVSVQNRPYRENLSDMMTTFKNVLTYFKQSGRALSGIQKLSLAPSAKLAVFPTVVLVPLYEEYQQPSGGLGRYTANYSLQANLYTKGVPISSTMRSGITLWESLQDIINWNPKLLDHTLDNTTTENVDYVDKALTVHIGNAALGPINPERAQGLQSVEIPIVIKTFLDLPAVITQSTTWQSGGVKPLLDAIYTTISGDSTLSSVFKTFEKQNIPPISKYPALTMGMEEVEQIRHTGWESRVVAVQLIVWSQMLPTQSSLTQHLSRVEQVRDVLFQNYGWGGLCVDSWIPRVDHGAYSADGKRDTLYSSLITLACEVRVDY